MRSFHKPEISDSIISTEVNQTPEPVHQFMFPKIRAHQFSSDTKYNSDPLEEYSCINNSSMLTTVVPQLDYLKYRDHHFSRVHYNSPRSQSDSPAVNYFYQPQILQVSPRSKVKVFSYFPISKERKNSIVKQRKSNIKGSKNFNNQPRVLPFINQKSMKAPDSDMKPALTYGDKLWKLYELADLDKKT